MPADSTHINYGIIDAKALNIEKDIVANHEDGYKSTFRFANNTANKTYNIPSISGASANVLTSEADLDATKLKIENLSEETTIANLDELPFCDVDDSDNKKKITFQNFVNAVETNIHGSASEAQFRIADASGDFQNKSISDDITIDKDGKARIQTSNMTSVALADLANADAVVLGDYSDSGKSKKVSLLNLSRHVLSERDATKEGGLQVSDGSGNYSELEMSGDATMDKNAVLTLADKPSATGAAEASKFLHCDASKNITSLNELGCADLTASGDVECVNNTVSGEMRFGSNKWKIAQSGNNLQFMEYSGTSWVVKFQIQGSGQS